MKLIQNGYSRPHFTGEKAQAQTTDETSPGPSGGMTSEKGSEPGGGLPGVFRITARCHWVGGQQLVAVQRKPDLPWPTRIQIPALSASHLRAWPRVLVGGERTVVRSVSGLPASLPTTCVLVLS